MDEGITYDQLPVMSPMMASNSNESGNGGGNGQTIMDDGENICSIPKKWEGFFMSKAEGRARLVSLLL